MMGHIVDIEGKRQGDKITALEKREKKTRNRKLRNKTMK